MSPGASKRSHTYLRERTEVTPRNETHYSYRPFVVLAVCSSPVPSNKSLKNETLY